MIDTYHCPRCSRLLTCSGAAVVDGEMLPVFQCDTCTDFVELFGVRVEAAYTFAVNARGEPIDPND